jgi:hypothetical protein
MPKYNTVVWEPNQDITADLLNQMIQNHIFLNDDLIEFKISNVNPATKEVRDTKWIVNHAALFAREITETPGSDLIYIDGKYPSFEKTYDFPGNNYWDGDYQPAVIMTHRDNRTLPLSVILTNVTPEKVVYRATIYKDMTIERGKEFHFDILAVGVKPVEDNELDSDTNPTP